jgi:MFS family permease
MTRDFRLLWAGQSISQVGDAVTVLALPLTAVLDLHASTLEVGALASAGSLPWLLLALPAGAWTDRLRRRPVLIAADAVRALLLLSVPVAWWLGRLGLSQLFLVAFLAGSADVLFVVAYTAYLPALVEQDELATANARLQTTESGSAIVGPALGGTLVQLLSAPGTLLLDAVSFAASAVMMVAIRGREPAPVPSGARLRTEIAEGLRATFGRPTLRALTLALAWANFVLTGLGAVTLVLLARGLHLSSAVIGASYAVMGLGGVVGGVVSARTIRRLGLARAIWLPAVLTWPLALLEPLVDRGAGLAAYAVGAFALDLGIVIFNVAVRTYLQTSTPDRLMGRTSASIRMFGRGAVVAGGVAGGAIGEALGNRNAMWCLTAGVAVLPLLLMRTKLDSEREERSCTTAG